mmetsp:Transcript_26920/g.84469  ORF Transcript_26920/g.84469 Transcript_26920/m.84469 type:complete len:144 (-) Transcript_26920:258-689(-)
MFKLVKIVALALCATSAFGFAPSVAPRTTTRIGLFGGGAGDKAEGGGGGGLGGMMDQMKKAQEMQKKVAEMQAKASEERITGESSDGLVKVIFTGGSEVQETIIDDAKIAEGAAAVSTSVTEAVKDGQTKCATYMMKAAQEVR